MTSFINLIAKFKLVLVSLVLCAALIFLSVPIAIDIQALSGKELILTPYNITYISQTIIVLGLLIVTSSIYLAWHIASRNDAAQWLIKLRDFLFYFYSVQSAFWLVMIIGLVWMEFKSTHLPEYLGVTLVMIFVICQSIKRENKNS